MNNKQHYIAARGVHYTKYMRSLSSVVGLPGCKLGFFGTCRCNSCRPHHLINELDKCILLCSNCHLEEHAKEIADKYALIELEIREYIKERQYIKEVTGVCIECKKKFLYKPLRGVLRNLCTKCKDEGKTKKLKQIKNINVNKIRLLAETKPLTEVAKEIGCAYTSLRRFCSKNNITAKSSGYWNKHGYKIDWPPDLILKNMVYEMPLIHLAKKLGVSDNAIKKRCKKRNIPLPKRGYWLVKANSKQQ